MHNLYQRVQNCGVTPPIEQGPLENAVFSPTNFIYQKHLKLGQCREIDDKRSLSKFGDVK